MAVGLVIYDGVRRTGTGTSVLLVNDPPGASAVGGALPTPGSGPSGERPSADSAGLRLRVMTFNIASGRGSDDRQDLDRIARTIRQAEALLAASTSSPPGAPNARPPGALDAVALQEVRVGDHGRSQAEYLAGKLTMRWVSAASERRWWREDFGNALLLGDGADGVMRIQLPQTQERGWRNVVVARVPLREPDGTLSRTGRSVTLLATHIDRRDDQPAQLRFVTELFLAATPPAVLLGDLNVSRSHPILRELVEKHDVLDATADASLDVSSTAAATAPATAPADPSPGASSPGKIDHIFVRGLRPVATGVVDLGGSDHPAVFAELRTP